MAFMSGSRRFVQEQKPEENAPFELWTQCSNVKSDGNLTLWPPPPKFTEAGSPSSAKKFLRKEKQDAKDISTKEIRQRSGNGTSMRTSKLHKSLEQSTARRHRFVFQREQPLKIKLM